MPATAMPSLSSNRISIPRQPGRYGAPAPEIGKLLFVASDVDSEGYSADPELELGPTTTGRRVFLTILIAWVVFGFTYFTVGLARNAFDAAAIVSGIVLAAPAAWLLWRGMGTTKRFGNCMYIGEDGVTNIAVRGKTDTATTTVYRDDLITTSSAANVSVNGQFAYNAVALSFWEADGRPVGHLFATFKRDGKPLVEGVRIATRACGERRLQGARVRLARGEQLVFPIVSYGRGPLRQTGEALVLDATSLSYFKSPQAQPLRVDRASAELTLREGFLDLRMRGSSVVLGTFERANLGNYDVLARLL